MTLASNASVEHIYLTKGYYRIYKPFITEHLTHIQLWSKHGNELACNQYRVSVIISPESIVFHL